MMDRQAGLDLLRGAFDEHGIGWCIGCAKGHEMESHLVGEVTKWSANAH